MHRRNRALDIFALRADVKAQEAFSTFAEGWPVVDGDFGSFLHPIDGLLLRHARSGDIHPSQEGGLKRHRSQTGNGIDASVKNFAIFIEIGQ